MKEVHLRRHAEKGPDGNLTEEGMKAAREMGRNLPNFVKVISSESERARVTAELMTG